MKVLKLENATAGYGNVIAIRDVSLEVPEGAIVTLLGSNGAGKSTTLKLISGIVKARAGTVSFGGENLAGMTPDRIVKLGIVHCPENRQVFPHFTVYENLMIGSYTRRDRRKVKEDLERVYDIFPRLRERSSQYAGTLSGGEQQMLAIGRALMAAPRLLLLDEPSLGLAPIIIREIFNIIKKINESGTSILLVEQNANLALKIADFAYVLEHGRIAISGQSDRLRNDGRIKELYLGSHS